MAARACSAGHTRRAGRRPPFGLSARELDVLRLIVAGHSDREIAEALFISPRTVTTHVSNIFNKLGLSTRAEAAAFAVRNGLVCRPALRRWRRSDVPAQGARRYVPAIHIRTARGSRATPRVGACLCGHRGTERRSPNA